MPPNTCLPMMIASSAPTTPIHQGAQGGRVIASSQPLSSAEPSSRKGFCGLFIRRSEKASAAIAVSRVTPNSQIAGQPNWYRPNRVAGSRASITSPMVRLTLDRPWV